MNLEEIIKLALEEDIRSGDITTAATVDKSAEGKGEIISRQNGVIAGLNIAEKVFHLVDEQLRITMQSKDGDAVQSEETLMEIRGKLSSILSAERVALNFLGRLSGIATLTGKFVEEIKGTACTILDTRKTTPLLRNLEKYAVRVGGAQNHRMGLYDMYLIKENHIAAAGGIEKSLQKAFTHRTKNQQKALVEIEVTDHEELKTALNYPVDRILLDNMSASDIREAVRICGGRTKLEASGGINLNNVREYAKTGVDFISMGEMTHSVVSFNLSLLVARI